MTIAWGNAAIAGIVATAVMTLFMYMAKAMGIAMDLTRMVGLMFTESMAFVYIMGLLVQFTNGVIFAVLYAVLFAIFGIPGGWLWGLIFGAVHGALAGFVMGMMPLVHPRMGPGKDLPSPGFFGKNISPMAPVVLMVLHLIYGVIVGALYFLPPL